jgi:hypothetical protein
VSWNPLRVTAVAVVLAASAPLGVGAQHLDAFFARQGPLTVSGGFDFDAGGAVIPTRVLTRALAFDPPVYVGSDPGYTAGAAAYPGNWTALPPDVDIPFEILWERTLGLNLSHWNGIGAPAFGPPPGGEVLVIEQNACISCAQAFAEGGEVDVPGFALGRTDANGSLHRHHDYFLLGDLALSDAPVPGVYLVALRARAGTLDWTPPFFLLLGAGATAAQLEAARVWVEANLVLPACSDGTDNDGDGAVDRFGGPDGEPPDAGCASPNDGSERSSCGLGAELAFLLPLWAWGRRRRAARQDT